MKSKTKSAYIIGGATVLAAIIYSVQNFVDSGPDASIENGSNNTIIQSDGDVNIETKVNDLSEIRKYDAESMKQSLVSGCQTLESKLTNNAMYDLDSVPNLIGTPYSDKGRFISLFGAEQHQSVMEVMATFDERYVEMVPALGYFAYMRDSMMTDAIDTLDDVYQQQVDESLPLLLASTRRLCEKFENLSTQN